MRLGAATAAIQAIEALKRQLEKGRVFISRSGLVSHDSEMGG